MLTIEEAKARILSAARNFGVEEVFLEESHGRIAAKQITAPIDLPMFDNSSVDGFAVQTSNILDATEENPVELKLIAVVPAGSSFDGEINSGECVQVFTGSKIPRGADAVVMIEATKEVEGQKNLIKVFAPARPWQNIRTRGEDILYGTPIVKAGERLTIGKVGVLSAVGIDKVSVWKRPRVAILSSGSELRKPGEILKPGEIYESNLLPLCKLVEKICGTPILKERISDDENSVTEALKKAFEKADVVITTGGVSVGKYDFIRTVFEKIGGKIEFWKVVMKPGRPLAFGRLNDKYLFGLPGNPVSALVTYTLFVRPFLLKSQNASMVDLPVEEGELVEEILNPGNRHHIVRVRIDERRRVRISGMQASHGLSSIIDSNGLIDVPPRAIFKKGDIVKVMKWEMSE